jgi:hypothetical protein
MRPLSGVDVEGAQGAEVGAKGAAEASAMEVPLLRARQRLLPTAMVSICNLAAPGTSPLSHHVGVIV